MSDIAPNKRYYLLALLFVLLLYGKTLTFSFVTDDWFNLFENAKVFNLADIKEIFTKPQINFGEAIYYRPFDTISFLALLKAFGDVTALYHLTNVLLLALFSFLFYYLLSLHFLDKRLSFFCLLIYLAHPLLVEPVAWISAKNQIVEGIMFLSALISLEKIAKEDSKYIILLFIAAVLALLFHDTGIMLLPLMWAYVLIFHKEKVRNKRYLSLLFLLTVFFTLLVFFRNSVVPFPKSPYPVKTHILTAITILAAYIKNMVFPFSLKIHYYNLTVKENFDSDLIVSSLILLITFVPLILYSKKNKIALFGSFFFLLTFFPASGLVKFIQKSLISDRYTFLPLIGVTIIVCSVLDKISKKTILYYSLCFVVLVFSITNFIRQDVWRDDLANAIERVREYPDNAVERSNLAAEYMKLGMLDSAEKELITAFQVSKKPEEGVYNNYAMLATLRGDLKLTEEIYLEYLKHNEKSHRTLYNLGTFYLERGEKEKAKLYLEKALRYVQKDSYEYADILNNLGIIAYLSNDKPLSKRCFEEALKARPYDERYRKNAELE
ncbi:MAG: hypothetical protein OHK0040_10400 [bacterium]